MVIVDKRALALTEFAYLWQVDNKEWKKQRKKDWALFVEGYLEDESKKNIAIYKKYFMSAESKDYINPVDKFLMTPFDSVKTVKSFFNSDVYDFSGREGLLASFVVYCANSKLNVELMYPATQLFVEGVLGREYRRIEELNGKTSKVISPHPSFWAGQYIVLSIKYLENKHLEYCPVVDTMDYFISVLRYADEADYRNPKEMSHLLTYINGEQLAVNKSAYAESFVRDLQARKEEIMAAWNVFSHLDS